MEDDKPFPLKVIIYSKHGCIKNPGYSREPLIKKMFFGSLTLKLFVLRYGYPKKFPFDHTSTIYGIKFLPVPLDADQDTVLLFRDVQDLAVKFITFDKTDRFQMKIDVIRFMFAMINDSSIFTRVFTATLQV